MFKDLSTKELTKIIQDQSKVDLAYMAKNTSNEKFRSMLEWELYERMKGFIYFCAKYVPRDEETQMQFRQYCFQFVRKSILEYNYTCDFGSYCIYWLRAAITQFNKYETALVFDKKRVPGFNALSNGAKLKYEINEEDLDKSRIHQEKPVTEKVKSIHSTVGNSGKINRTIEDYLVSETESPDELVIQRERKELCKEIFCQLTPTQAKIIKQSMGFYGGECSLREVSRSVGITYERVRQIKKFAFEKLKKRYEFKKKKKAFDEKFKRASQAGDN